jgi:hypothetical protein
MEDGYSAEAIHLLDGLEPPRHSVTGGDVGPTLLPRTDLQLLGISQDENDRRIASIMDAIRMNQGAGLEPTTPLVALGERYISGEITVEEYGSAVANL